MRRLLFAIALIALCLGKACGQGLAQDTLAFRQLLSDKMWKYYSMQTLAYAKHIERGSIEIAPLAYMRGRTLSNSFIILDEAQNTTREQMKMFLTRMGENSRIVVTGDVTQIDLPKNVKSGLIDALDVLKDVEGIEIVRLSAKDVVRHELVTRIIQAYEKAESHSYAETQE